MRRLVLWAIVSFALAPFVGIGADQPTPRGCGQAGVTQLLQEWRHADWRAWFRVGASLSDCVAADPDTFFRAMLGDRHSFDTWLLGLNGHTFMYSEPADKARLQKLKAKMTKIARQAAKSRDYGDLAKALLQRMATVSPSEATPRIIDYEPGA
jgi:hypothetical protein